MPPPSTSPTHSIIAMPQHHLTNVTERSPSEPIGVHVIGHLGAEGLRVSGTVWQMDFAALLISVIALAVSTMVGWRAIRLSRQANAVPMLVDLFREHRSAEMAQARRFVYTQLTELDISEGLAGLGDDSREKIRILSCYYDNLGALVAHGIVDLDIVAGYMGSSVVSMWDKMQPLIAAERAARPAAYDNGRWQRYFENLQLLIKQRTPSAARFAQPMWLAR